MTRKTVVEYAFVYGLRPRGTLDYFYVGSTKKTLADRLKRHLDPLNLAKNPNRHFVNKVRKIGPENVMIDQLEKVPIEVRFDREYAKISKFLKKGFRLTNVVISKEDESRYYRERFVHHYEGMLDQPGWLFDCILYVFSDEGMEKKSERDLAWALGDFARKCFWDLLENNLEEFICLLCVGCEKIIPELTESFKILRFQIQGASI